MEFHKEKSINPHFDCALSLLWKMSIVDPDVCALTLSEHTVIASALPVTFADQRLPRHTIRRNACLCMAVDGRPFMTQTNISNLVVPFELFKHRKTCLLHTKINTPTKLM